MKLFKYLIISILSINSSLLVASDSSITEGVFKKGQTWEGWNDCQEGDTALKLTIVSVSNISAKAQNIVAIYEFTTKKGANGVLQTNGLFSLDKQVAKFRTKKWIKRPNGHRSPRFSGNITNNGKEFRGKIRWRDCTGFHLHSPDSKYVTDARKGKKIANKLTSSTVDSVVKEKKRQSLSWAPGLRKTTPEKSPSRSLAAGNKSLSNSEKSSYRFETDRPPSRGSYSVYMHFDTLQDVAEVSDKVDDIVKADLSKRARASGNTSRISAQYTFFVNGKEIEWRRYEYRKPKGWEPIIGVSLESKQKGRRTYQQKKGNERIISSIIDESGRISDSPEKLRTLFNLGFYETGPVPSGYKFTEIRKMSTDGEKWYKKKKHILKGISYSIEVKVDDIKILVADRDSLVNYAKSDIKNRVGNNSYDKFSAFYWFKSGNTTKHSVTLSLNKQAGDGLTISKSLARLEDFATTDDDAFSSRYGMTKEMWLASENGNKKGLDKIRKKRIAEVEKASSGPSLELNISSRLSAIQRLPVLYVHESRKWNKVGGLSKQAIARKVANKHKFPLKKSLSTAQIDKKKQEIAKLINALSSKAEQLRKTTSKKLSGAKQNELAAKVLYPALVKIQTKIIALLAGIPRTEKGFEIAYDVNDWLGRVETDYRSHWSRLIQNQLKIRGGKRQPNPMCTQLSTNKQVALDKATGRCFFEITHSSKLLRDVWRIQYMRAVDKLISKKIEQNGPELYHRVFQFAFDVRAQEFANGLPNLKTLPPNSNERCLYEACSSQLAKLYESEGKQSVLTNQRKRTYLARLQRKSAQLLKQWESSTGKSKLDRQGIKTDMVDYSRGVAKAVLNRLSSSAANELEKLRKKDSKGFKHWNQKVAKPIRLQVVVWQKLWDIGFGVSQHDNALSALGIRGGVNDYLRARHHGGSPFVGIAEILYDAQYRWVSTAEKGSTADQTVKFPEGWSSSGSYRKPARPKLYYAQLMTPSELFFESIGKQIGDAASALASYGGQLAELNKRIAKSRKQYFSCYPKCKDIRQRYIAYSRAMIEKDLYFLKISGRSGSLSDKGQQAMSTVVEGFGGSRGATLIDGGIQKVCFGYFDQWTTKFGRLNQSGGRNEIDSLFMAANKMTSGDFSGMKQQGFRLLKRQREAFAKAATEYRRYQVCRDQWEFDRYTKGN